MNNMLRHAAAVTFSLAAASSYLPLHRAAESRGPTRSVVFVVRVRVEIKGPHLFSTVSETGPSLTQVPVHPPKFGDFCRLVDSNTFNNTLIGVFSSVHDQQACPCRVESLVVEPDKGQIVTSKKWLAVKAVFDARLDVRAIIALDSESRFHRRATDVDIEKFQQGVVPVW